VQEGIGLTNPIANGRKSRTDCAGFIGEAEPLGSVLAHGVEQPIARPNRIAPVDLTSG
jgi:hypothetical protein